MSFAEFFWQLDSARLRDEVEWRQTREIVAIIYNTNAKKTKLGKDLIPLTIDECLIEVPKKLPTHAEIKEIIKARKEKFKDVEPKPITSTDFV